MTLPFNQHLTRTFPITAVTTFWSPTPFTPPPAVANQIATSWESALRDAALHGRDLFSGAMTRLIGWTADANSLHLDLGPTDYRTFVGTNLRHPEIANQFGRDALANPLGISIAVITSNNQIVLQKRSQHVFELPGYYHVGGGNVEPIDVAGPNAPGIAETVRRELEEELEIRPEHIVDLLCLGLAENVNVRKPDLLVASYITLPSTEIATRQHPEYSELAFIADKQSLSNFLTEHARTTSPAGIACLLALGHHLYGQTWFEPLLTTLEELFR
jgi:8-oxo-dGTP pyrophosphatase MutT (NUDIX family)